MSTSKRGGSQRNSSNDLLPTVTLILGLIVMSFLLGVFVLPRLLPDKTDAKPGVSPPVTPANSITPVNPPVNPSPAPDSPGPPEQHQPVADTTTSIEPGDFDKSQKPRKLNDEGEGANLPDPNKPDPNKPDAVNKAEANPDGDNSRESGSGTGNMTPEKTEPHKENGQGEGNTTRNNKTGNHGRNTDHVVLSTDDNDAHSIVQRPSRIDGEPGTSRPTSDTGQAKSARTRQEQPKRPDESDVPTTHARYIVTAGAYTQRATAEQICRRVQDLGLKAELVMVTDREGAPVYRVQQDIYNKRSQAKAAAQRLKKALPDLEPDVFAESPKAE